MSDERKFGISDLEIESDIDTEIGLDNDNYQDQVNPAPPAAGTYAAVALALATKKTREGKAILESGKFPIIVLEQVELVDGLLDASGNATTRKVSLYQDVGTRPFERFGTVVSPINDLLRSYGASNYSGLDGMKDALKEQFELGKSFVADFDWSVYDKDFVTAALEQLEIPASKDDRSDDEKKLVNAIYRTARVTGMKQFPFNSNSGRFVHVLQRENVQMKNPVTGAIITIEGDHRTMEARLTITRYRPAVDVEAGRVKLGPSKVKAPAQAAAA